MTILPSKTLDSLNWFYDLLCHFICKLSTWKRTFLLEKNTRGKHCKMNICRNLRSLGYFEYSCKLISVCWTLQKTPTQGKIREKSETVHHTETHVRHLAFRARNGQKVKSSNSCSRILAPQNQLSLKQPEAPVTRQSQLSLAWWQCPLEEEAVWFWMLIYLLDCWNGEKVANRKHQKGRKV